MAWMDDLLGKTIAVDGAPVIDRKILNFIPGSAVSVVDNPVTKTTDVTISTGTTPGVMSGSGTTSLSAVDSGKTLFNTAIATWNLPAASNGLGFEIINMVSGGTTIKANGTDLIEFFNSTSSAGGTQNTTDVFASVRLRAVGNKWIAVGAPTGTWAAS